MQIESKIETKIQQTVFNENQKLSAAQSELLSQLHSAVLNERNSTLLVIELLRKAEQENLYLVMGFESLKEFCMKEYKYSETAANRRISALRVVQEIPEIEKKIEEGSLSLTVISQAASHIYQKEKQQKSKLDVSEKKELFEKLENLSMRATEKVLFQDAPEIIQKKEKLRQVSEELQELKIILTPEMQKDLQELKMLISHQRSKELCGEKHGANVVISFKGEDALRDFSFRLITWFRSREVAPMCFRICSFFVGRIIS